MRSDCTNYWRYCQWHEFVRPTGSRRRRGSGRSRYPLCQKADSLLGGGRSFWVLFVVSFVVGFALAQEVLQ